MPVCLLLTLVRRIGDRWRFVRGQPRRELAPLPASPCVVIVKLSEMGSTVLALDALKRLGQRYPGAKLHYACFEENRAVLDILPGIFWAGVHTIRTRSLFTVLCDGWRVARLLRKLRPDAAIDLEVFSRASSALVFASGAARRVGFHRFQAEGMNCGNLYTHRLSFNNHLHTAGAFLALVEALAADPDDLPMLKRPIEIPAELPKFQNSPAEHDRVRSALTEQGLPADGSAELIILNPNTSDLLPLRKWPTENFVKLARHCLNMDPRIWIVLTGTAQEATAIKAIASRIDRPRVISMAGRTTLRELLTLYQMARVLVTNDSGPVHFASLTSVRVIALFGPETPALYGPRAQRHTAITAGLACSPCIHPFNARRTVCTNNRCMQAITVEQVLTAVRTSFADQNATLQAI